MYYIPIRRSKKVKVAAAIDSFKGSMTSLEVAEAFEKGVKKDTVFSFD